MCLDLVLSIVIMEMAVFLLKIQRYSQLMEEPRKNSSVRQQSCHHRYKDKNNLSQSFIIFIITDSVVLWKIQKFDSLIL